MKTLLDLPNCNLITVFLECVRVIQSDKVVASIVRSDGWVVWDGNGPTLFPFAPNRAITARIAPAVGPDDWYSPDMTIRQLVVNVDFDIQSTCIADPHNFWQAVQRAFYPPPDGTTPDPQQVIELALVNAGAMTGIIHFAGPNVVPASGEGEQTASFLRSRGVLKLDIRNVLNP